MSWVAEILRKEHRNCRRCDMGPTHVYRPEPESFEDAAAQDQPPQSGTPLCTSCLAGQIEKDFAAYGARCILFEPSLGPDRLEFVPLDEAPAPPAARAALGRAGSACAECGAAGRFIWVPSEPDANLWGDEWVAALQSGELTATDALCGACAARRLMRTIEQRGLYFEAIILPLDGDGALLCSGE